MSIHWCMVETIPLSVARWLQEGLAVLATDGHANLRAAGLAQRLGVTRGSFYWHFADIAVFHAALLQHWAETAVNRPLAAAEARAARPADRLGALIDMAFTASPELERAVHAWAAVDERAAKAVADVTASRTGHLRRMLEAAGFAADAAEARATVLYWAFLGRYVEPGLPGREGCIALIKDLVLKA